MQNHTIVDRIVERLKTQPIGDFITEEDIYEIVAQAIPKAFFEDRKVPGRYGEFEKKEPLLVEVVRDVMQVSVRACVDHYFVEHAENIAAKWKTVFDEGIVQYTERVLNEKTNSVIKAAVNEWIKQLNDQRQQEASRNGGYATFIPPLL